MLASVREHLRRARAEAEALVLRYARRTGQPPRPAVRLEEPPPA